MTLEAIGDKLDDMVEEIWKLKSNDPLIEIAEKLIDHASTLIGLAEIRERQE